MFADPLVGRGFKVLCLINIKERIENIILYKISSVKKFLCFLFGEDSFCWNCHRFKDVSQFNDANKQANKQTKQK